MQNFVTINTWGFEWEQVQFPIKIEFWWRVRWWNRREFFNQYIDQVIYRFRNVTVRSEPRVYCIVCGRLYACIIQLFLLVYSRGIQIVWTPLVTLEYLKRNTYNSERWKEFKRNSLWMISYSVKRPWTRECRVKQTETQLVTHPECACINIRWTQVSKMHWFSPTKYIHKNSWHLLNLIFHIINLI